MTKVRRRRVDDTRSGTRIVPATTIPRDAVVKILVDTDRPIVAISAPAGYGKTTVVSLWDQIDDRPFAWARLDAGDVDPDVLVERLIEAIDLATPTERAGSPDIDLRGPGHVVGDLLDRVESASPLVLVLDGLDCIAPAAAGVIDLTADMLPPDSQIVLIGRSLDALALSRHRLEGDVTEVGIAELALSDSEADQLLDRLGVEPARRATERDLGDGWPAGLALLARTDGHDLVTPYVEEQVLVTLPDQVVRFLERAALIDDLDLDSIGAVLDQTDAAKVFDDLERDGSLPLRSGMAGAGTFPPARRLHPLVSGVLRTRLEHRDVAEARWLHRRASTLGERSGDTIGAVQHSVDAGDIDRAADLVLGHVPHLLLAGDVDDLVDLLVRLGPGAEQLNASAALALGWCAIGLGDPPMLGRALSALAGNVPTADSPPRLTSAMAALRAMLAPDGLYGVLDDTEAVRRAGDASNNTWWAIATFAQGATYYLLERDEFARARFASLSPLVADSPGLGAVTLSYMALLDLDADDLPTARRRLDDASRLLERHRLDRAVLLVPAFAIGARVAAIVGEPDVARTRIAQASSMIAALDPLAPRTALMCGIHLGIASLHLGDVAAARNHAHDAVAARRLDASATRLNRELDHLLARLESGTEQLGLDADQLTPAELKVLALFPTHLSLQGIADELIISRNTAKSHAVAIYRKLQVSKRSEAVEAARRLGILPAAPT